MTEELPGEQVGRRVTVEFRTTSDIYADNFRIINRELAREFMRLLDREAGMDRPVGDPRRQLIRGEAAEGEQGLPRPREVGEGLGGQLPVGQVDRAQAVRRVITKWAPLLDPADPAVAAELTRLLQKLSEAQATFVDHHIDLILDVDEP
jgi:hypothetical protein